MTTWKNSNTGCLLAPSSWFLQKRGKGKWDLPVLEAERERNIDLLNLRIHRVGKVNSSVQTSEDKTTIQNFFHKPVKIPQPDQGETPGQGSDEGHCFSSQAYCLEWTYCSNHDFEEI